MCAGADSNGSGLLDGLNGRARQERAELVDWLFDRGFDADQIRTSLIPILLPANRVVGDDGIRASAREISDESGIELNLLLRLQRAAGLPEVEDPDVPDQLRVDGGAVVRTKALLDLGLDVDRVIGIVRVLNEGLGRAAEAMRQAAVAAALEPGSTELQLARAIEDMAKRIAPALGPMIEDLLRLQLRRSIETEAVNEAERAEGVLPGARQVAVAFADLVGFTRLGEESPPEELERLANQLAEVARDVAVKPVRLVKTIGDAVMLVSAEPAALVRAMVQLVVKADAVGLPAIRCGLAAGRAISHSGDLYGSPVNLASRVTAIASPGTVLVTEAIRSEVGETEEFVWASVGARHLKGVSTEVRLFTASLSNTR